MNGKDDTQRSQLRAESLGEPSGTPRAFLTDVIHRGVFGLSVQEHRALKRLPPTEELRDHMTIEELSLIGFVESLTLSLHEERHSFGLEELWRDATETGEIGGKVRKLMEAALGRSVVSESNFLHLYQMPQEPSSPQKKPRQKEQKRSPRRQQSFDSPVAEMLKHPSPALEQAIRTGILGYIPEEDESDARGDA
jgi:hypothetical protein